MSDPRLDDTSVFPDAVYKDTVLRPLFDGAKTHHVESFEAIDKAHLVMLVETGILDPAQGRDIARALRAIAAEVDPSTLVYTGEVEDYFFLIEKLLKTRLGPDLAGRLHTARSRNDIDHTLFKLGLKARLDVLLAKARALYDVLVTTAARDKAVLIVAYTHGQPAQPSTFGHYLGAVIEVLGRDIDRLQEAYGIVDQSPMGAAAITTSGFPIDRERVAQLLGGRPPDLDPAQHRGRGLLGVLGHRMAGAVEQVAGVECGERSRAAQLGPHCLHRCLPLRPQTVGPADPGRTRCLCS